MSERKHYHRLVPAVATVLLLPLAWIAVLAPGASARTLPDAPFAISAPAPQASLSAVSAVVLQQAYTARMAALHAHHLWHEAAVLHEAHLAWLARQAALAKAAAARAAAQAAYAAAHPAPVHIVTAAKPLTVTAPAPVPVAHVTGGTLSYSGLESLWESAGGPSWAAPQAAQIAECESGGNQMAYNPSGASGYWQILGQVVGGWIFDPMVNAENAVAKFRASGNNFSAWVCR